MQNNSNGTSSPRHALADVQRAKAIVEAATFYDDPEKLAVISEDLGEAMVGINCDALPEEEHLDKRGW